MTPDRPADHLAILTAILEERTLAYAVTDGRLRVEQLCDPADLFCLPAGRGLGQPLLEIAPELIGHEAALDELLAGRLNRLQIQLFSRSAEDGATRYYRLLARPRPAALNGSTAAAGSETAAPAPQPATPRTSGIILFLEDITFIGEIQQRLMQSHNELLLQADALNRANRELAAANQELRKLADIRSTFVSMAAHELRTPLAVMRGYAEMLLDETLGALNDAQRESLETLRNGSDRLLEIVNNLLDLTRLEASRMELVLHALDLGDLARAVAREFRPLLEAKQQSLAVAVASDLPAALCDEARVFQILSNLLSNASKYTPAGGKIELSVGLADTADELLVVVRDTGVGIPADQQDQLGALFFRARTANQMDARGVGLGLYITRSLVQLHGGRLWFESQEGQGSTFAVTFLQADGSGY